MRIPFNFPLHFQLKISKRVLIVIAIMVPVVVLSSLPLIAKTSTYPVAVVSRSMVPALHNGDLVFYTAPHGPVKNGTIIVFIQVETGVAVLDSLLKPIVI